MPEAMTIAKATLCEIDAKERKPINDDRTLTVQFNPDSLKVSFANQIEKPSGTGDQNGAQSQQFVGAGSTKLAATLWFDVTQALEEKLETNDVRALTGRVAYFITPRGEPVGDPEPKKYIPPAVRFEWGTFQFDGMMETLEESIELFSAEGLPLRASVAITITQQKITAFAPAGANIKPRGYGRAAGTQPQVQAPEGSSVQSLAAAQPGGGRDWQSVAAANGIENPRHLQPGQFIDFQKAG